MNLIDLWFWVIGIVWEKIGYLILILFFKEVGRDVLVLIFYFFVLFDFFYDVYNLISRGNIIIIIMELFIGVLWV